MKPKTRILPSLCAALTAWTLCVGSGPAQPSSARSAPESMACVLSCNWVVRSEDNVAGVSVARRITHPARVDFEKLMRATPEVKSLRKEGIERTSARGQILLSAAQSRVRRAARQVMNEKSHCSVWKEIRHKDERLVPDVTAAVLRELAP